MTRNVLATSALILLLTTTSTSCTQHTAPHPAATGSATRSAEAAGAPLFDDLGDHHHAITTSSEAAQRYFDQGLTLVYAFNHAEAIRSFREAARLDPASPMPWWGVALAHGPNINRPMTEDDAPAAWDALQRARALAANGSERERAYVEALSARYAEQLPEDRSQLDRAYADAMRELAARHPEDLDAATLFAEALMDTMPWEYWTEDGQPRPATRELLAALEGVLERNPDHPGANHYYIHAVEAVEPERALDAADRLRGLVPGAGHLVHMPSHVYLRMGLYREATLANERAAEADESYIAQCREQGFYPALYYPHNVHFLWYTNAMEGRSAPSIEAARAIGQHVDGHDLIEAQRLRPLETMALVRFGRWDEILRQPRPPAERRFESAAAHHARGLALVARGRLDEAAEELAALGSIVEDDGRESFDSPYLPGEALVTIARHDLTGHLTLARGEHDAAIAELRQAVAIEDALPYMEPPFAYLPMRHGLGAALLAAGRPAEAEAVYREDLSVYPHNGWSLTGLEASLRAQGKDALADEVRHRKERAWIRADGGLASSRL